MSVERPGELGVGDDEPRRALRRQAGELLRRAPRIDGDEDGPEAGEGEPREQVGGLVARRRQHQVAVADPGAGERRGRGPDAGGGLRVRVPLLLPEQPVLVRHRLGGAVEQLGNRHRRRHLCVRLTDKCPTS
jgi:hypothetical protein